MNPRDREQADSMILAAQASGLPIVEFEDLGRLFKNVHKIDVRDVCKNAGHFDAWHRRNRLPKTDSEGKPYRSSQAFYLQYLEDPTGSAACPPYVDFWHWLVDATRTVPWIEDTGARWKIVPIRKDMLEIPRPKTVGELADIRSRIEANGPLPGDVLKSLLTEITSAPAKAQYLVDVINKAIDLYGGPFALRMRVNC